LTILVVGFGVLPEQLLQLARSAADGLADPSAYIFSVFPEGTIR
jgi:multicomponent Na+:H+ antiporter subunit D